MSGPDGPVIVNMAHEEKDQEGGKTVRGPGHRLLGSGSHSFPVLAIMTPVR